MTAAHPIRAWGGGLISIQLHFLFLREAEGQRQGGVAHPALINDLSSDSTFTRTCSDPRRPQLQQAGLDQNQNHASAGGGASHQRLSSSSFFGSLQTMTTSPIIPCSQDFHTYLCQVLRWGRSLARQYLMMSQMTANQEALYMAEWAESVSRRSQEG